MKEIKKLKPRFVVLIDTRQIKILISIKNESHRTFFFSESRYWRIGISKSLK